MKTVIIGVAVLIVAGAGYFLVGDGACKGFGCGDMETSTYSSSELGFQFTYPTGPDGYQIREQTPNSSDGLERVIVLMRNEDAGNIPEGGEGPPTITILVVANPEGEAPRTWADKHAQFSNVNLGRGEITNTRIDGKSAIRYMADGLYVSENVIAAHGDNVFVFSGMFLDENSAIRRDFSTFLDSVTFLDPEA